MTEPTAAHAERDRPALGTVMRRVTARLVPFLLLMYVLSFLDRVNIGFAKDAYQADVGLSNAAYALGAGIFFVGYAAFEVPSNLIMHRVGARVWMCRIMVTWGLISAAMMFAHSEAVFYLLRTLLGIAEAGFFPGVIFYLTAWVPAEYRGRVVGLFYFGAPLAFVLGGPVSGALLELDGWAGLHGWQWMFLVEGLAATVVGIAAFFYLDNRPEDARWLSDAERSTLVDRMRDDERDRATHSPGSALRTLADPAVLYLGLLYFLIQLSVYGVTFYLPTQIADLAGAEVGLLVGLLTAVPWTCAAVATFLLGRLSDRTGVRRGLAAVAMVAGAVGIAGSVAVGSAGLALAALCLAASGFIAVQPIFWTLPASLLTGTAAAAGIGLVNAVGSLGGFVAPNVKTWMDALTGGGDGGLYLLAATTLLGAVLVLVRVGPRAGQPSSAAR